MLPSAEEMRQAALAYHRENLAITLCPPSSKKPLGDGWTKTCCGKGWPQKRWCAREIGKAFHICGPLNVGALWGPSSEMIDLEEDSPQAKQALAWLFAGSDPPVTPTFLSRRGHHRLYAWDGRFDLLNKATVHLGDLEIKLGAKGKGSQSLLPPSTTDGHTRKWVVSFDECRPASLPEPVIRKILDHAGNRLKDSEGQTHRGHREHKTCHVCSVSSAPSVCLDDKSIDPMVISAIEATLPQEIGGRHRLLFAFGRQLKAMPKYANADVRQLKPLVQIWHQAALPFIGTKPFEETWLDFAEGWPKIKYAAGTEPIYVAFQRAIEGELPVEALQYEQEALQRLVALCRQLQADAGSSTFYLAGRVAADLVGAPHTQVARWLRLLVVDGVIVVVKEGSRHRATEYRYRGH